MYPAGKNLIYSIHITNVRSLPRKTLLAFMSFMAWCALLSDVAFINT
ncbi:exported hypothetical protein [Photobacterium kishitanii]|nr:exported hypothetical protein [Photobacterium kishitanii]